MLIWLTTLLYNQVFRENEYIEILRSSELARDADEIEKRNHSKTTLRVLTENKRFGRILRRSYET